MHPWWTHLHHVFSSGFVYLVEVAFILCNLLLAACSFFSRRIISSAQECRRSVFRCDSYVNIQWLMLALSTIPSFSQQNPVQATRLQPTKPLSPTLWCSQTAIMKLFCCSVSVRHMCDENKICSFLRLWCIVIFPYNKYLKTKFKTVWQKDIKAYLIHFDWANTEFCQQHVSNTSQPCIPSLPHPPYHSSCLMA